MTAPVTHPCQLDLGLGAGEPPALPEVLLRAAHARCRLSMGFDEAMRLEVLRICFRAMARRTVKSKRMGK